MSDTDTTVSDPSVTETSVAPVPAPEPPVGVQTPAPITPVTQRQPGDPLSDPRVQAEIRKQVTEAARKAAEEAKAELAAEAAKAAERAQMDEISRTKAEKADEESKRKAAEELAQSAERVKDVALALVAHGVALADANAIDFLKFQVQEELKKQPGAAASAVVQNILAAHPYLVKTPVVPTTEAATVTPVVTPPTVAATPPTTTQTRTQPAPQTVDVMSMSKEEYDAYKRKHHGM